MDYDETVIFLYSVRSTKLVENLQRLSLCLLVLACLTPISMMGINFIISCEECYTTRISFRIKL